MKMPSLGPVKLAVGCQTREGDLAQNLPDGRSYPVKYVPRVEVSTAVDCTPV